ncbi:partitioning defective 3 homolog [Saccoglossus kowalevskii]
MEKLSTWNAFFWEKIYSGYNILKKTTELSKTFIVKLTCFIFWPPEYWVNVRSLENLNDGGILDLDDQVYDVADDREKLLAIFEEQGRPLPPHNGGDGTSASSAGTASPEMFHSEIGSVLARDQRNQQVGYQAYNIHDVDVDVTSRLQVTDNKLHVRHGSEPALRSVSPISPEERYNDDDNEKRWTPTILEQKEHSSHRNSSTPKENNNGYQQRNGTEEEISTVFSRFGRDSARQSILGNHPSMYKWAEAQDKVDIQDTDRHDPVGGDLPVGEKSPADGSSQDSDIDSFVIELRNDGSPVGLHVVPYTDAKDGRELGMLVRGVEEGSKASTDGRILVNDRIIEINNLTLSDVTFERAQDIFRKAMTTFPYVRLRIERDKHPSRQISEEDNVHHNWNVDVMSEKPTPKYPHLELPDVAKDAGTPSSKKAPPAVPLRSPNTVLSTPIKDRTNVRKIGKKLHIQLTKGPQGLGFSITTRDNPTGGKNPIYIKNILPKGAAINDGRLKSGDRLLEVNGNEMTGKSQADAVSILRSTKLGSDVVLVISRQEAVGNKLPRQLPIEHQEEITPTKTKEILTFDIPLNETGSAGLGLSVKGKTTGNGKEGEKVPGSKDLGIFIKSVIHGGAASKDGRLRPNDQLLYINDESLLGLANSDAMEMLRKSMSSEKSPRSTIKLLIARRSDASLPTSPLSPSTIGFKMHSQDSLHGSNDQAIDIGLSVSRSEDSLNRHTPSSHISAASASASETSENSDNTVLYNPPKELEFEYDQVPESLQHPSLRRLKNLEGKNLARNNSYNLAMGPASNPPKFTTDLETVDGSKVGSAGTITTHSSTGIVAPTLPMGNTETVIIEDTDTEQDGVAAETSINAPSSSQWLKENGDQKSSEDDGAAFFQREGFGRQSISEKHKGSATIDAKQTDWYAKHRKHPPETDETASDDSSQANCKYIIDYTNRTFTVRSLGVIKCKNKTNKELDSCDSTQSNTGSPGDDSDIGPSLGMKKSSSLESLQTMVAEVTKDETNLYPRPRQKVVRGRGCNESFRAAVDRSYDDDVDDEFDDEEMQTLDAVEEGSEAESRSRSGSTRSSIDSLTHVTDPITGNQLALPKNKQSHRQKKKSGLFKGLGHMFKFGQKRRGMGEGGRQSDLLQKQKEDEIERYKARLAAKEEHQRIQEQHKKLREQEALKRQQEDEQVNHQALNREAINKSQRMLQLRQQHQQRHHPRHDEYEDEEHKYKKNEQRVSDSDGGYSDYSNHSSATDANITQYLTQREQKFAESRNSPVPKSTEYAKLRQSGGRDSPNPAPRTHDYLDHTRPELRYSDYYSTQPRSNAYTYGSLGRPAKLHPQRQLDQTGNNQRHENPVPTTQRQYATHSSHGRTTPTVMTGHQESGSHYGSLGRTTPTVMAEHQEGSSHYSSHGRTMPSVMAEHQERSSHFSSHGRTTPSVMPEYQERSSHYSSHGRTIPSVMAEHQEKSSHERTMPSVMPEYQEKSSHYSSHGQTLPSGMAEHQERSSHYSSHGRTTPSVMPEYQEKSSHYRSHGRTTPIVRAEHCDTDSHYSEHGNYVDQRRYRDSGNYDDQVSYRNARQYKESVDVRNHRHSGFYEDSYYQKPQQDYTNNQNYGNNETYKDSRQYDDRRNYRDTENYVEPQNYDNSRYYFKDRRDPEKV